MQRCTAISTARVAAPSRPSMRPGARVSLRLTGRLDTPRTRISRMIWSPRALVFARRSRVLFNAHRLVLSTQTATLLEMCTLVSASRSQGAQQVKQSGLSA
eukprot:3672282-Pleurochrysis_carterae.AAC.1